MEILKFGVLKTGTLVPIIVPGTREADHAFVPQDLPPSWRMPEATTLLYADALGALRELNGACKTLPNPKLLIRPLQQREAIHSSKIEGTYTTPTKFLFAELEAEGRSNPEVDEQSREVHNYYAALRFGSDELTKADEINAAFVSDLHERLLRRVRGHDKERGKFRPDQAYVGSAENRRRYVPPPPTEMQERLTRFWEYLASDDGRFPPLVRAFLVHYQFEAIHPFADGNGRVGRLLLTLSVFRWVKLGLPWLYMSEYFERTKGEYVQKLFRVSTDGEWAEWIDYCLTGAAQTASESLKRIEGLLGAQKEFRHKVATKKKRLPDIVDRLVGTPLISVSDVETQFIVAYDTARADLSLLEDLGIIKELPGFRPKVFWCPEIYRIAYGANQ